MLRQLKHLLLAEDGQDLIEYALLAALISVVSVAALNSLGPAIAALFDSINAALAA